MSEKSEDTEITLGPGKILALFFGLVAICAVFFAMGYSFGKSSVTSAVGPPATATTANPGTRPSAVKNNPPASDLTFYKAVEQKDSTAQLPASTNQDNSAASAAPAPQADPTAAPASANFFVQVAAVTRQEDADALVDALKKKQYAALATTSALDKFIHVQVGPFSDIKDAEQTRAKLVSDGYNAILKK